MELVGGMKHAFFAQRLGLSLILFGADTPDLGPWSGTVA